MPTITTTDVFNIIRTINDPEHPKTLEQLEVVQEGLITLDGNHITLTFTPTIPHCSMATLIGLCIRVKLERNLPAGYKFDVSVTPGTHSQEQQVSKQLRDKERVSAALENPSLLDVVEKCIEESNLNNPLFFNPDASCGNNTGASVEENKNKEHEESGCCGGHGGEEKTQCCQNEKQGDDEDNNNKEQPKDECCGGKENNGGECCQNEKKQDDAPKNENKDDECCGGGDNGECCQGK